MTHTSKFPFRTTYEYRGATYERDMDAGDLRKALGFTGPYPGNARSEAVINGHTVYLRAKTRKHMEMRVWTTCPDCGKEIVPGKLRQHMKEQRKREEARANGKEHMLRRVGETNQSHQKRCAEVWQM